MKGGAQFRVKENDFLLALFGVKAFKKKFFTFLFSFLKKNSLGQLS
jgi:hypothetical protein